MTSRARLDELLEAVRSEFDNLTRETSRYKDDHHEYELKLNQQHQELTNISNTVYELEQAHRSMKDAYEREIIKLKQELEVRDRLLEQHSIQQQQQQVVHYQQLQQQQQQQQSHSLAATPQQLPPPNLSVSPTDNRTTPSSTVNTSVKPLITPLANSNGSASNPTVLPPPPLNNNSSNLGSTSVIPSNTATNNANNVTPAISNNILTTNATSSSTLAPLQKTNELKKSPVGETATTANISAASNNNNTTTNNNNNNNNNNTPTTTTTATTTTTNAAAENEQSSASPSNAIVPTVGNNELKRAQHNKPIPGFLKDFDAFASLPYKKQQNDYYLVYNPNIPKKVDISLVYSFDHTSVVCCVRFSKDGKFLATGCNKLTQVFSVETGELVARLNDESSLTNNNNSNNSNNNNSNSNNNNNNNNNNSNNSNGGSNNSNGTGYDTDTGDLYIRSVCFSPDGKFLATGAEDKIIRIWDLATRTIVKYLKGHEQDIYSLDFFPDGKRLVSGSGDRTVRIWDVFNGQCSLTLSIEDGVTTVAVSPDGSLIAAGSLDRTVRVWDANKGYLIERLDSSYECGNGHMDSVYSVTFTNQGKEIASGSLDRTIKLWTLKDLDKQPSVSKSDCEVTYVGHKDFVLSVCCTPDDEFILSGSKDRGVIMWDKKTGEPYIMLQGHRNSVISVSVSPVINPAGGYFATGSGDCKARIWKWERVTEEPSYSS